MALVVTTSSKVTKANTTNSLRTTIPVDVVKEIDLQVGDLLIWSIEHQKGKKTISIKKVDG